MNSFGIPPQLKRQMEEKALETMGEVSEFFREHVDPAQPCLLFRANESTVWDMNVREPRQRCHDRVTELSPHSFK